VALFERAAHEKGVTIALDLKAEVRTVGARDKGEENREKRRPEEKREKRSEKITHRLTNCSF
jgi:hypothetical protein